MKLIENFCDNLKLKTVPKFTNYKFHNSENAFTDNNFRNSLAGAMQDGAARTALSARSGTTARTAAASASPSSASVTTATTARPARTPSAEKDVTRNM